MQRAADAAAQMDAAGEKVTVSAVHTRAGVSMDAARQGVEQWRNGTRPPEVPMPDAVQRAFATAWATAATDAATCYETDRAAAGKLVDTESVRADKEAERAIKAKERAAGLEEQLAELMAGQERQRQTAAAAFKAERTAASQAREALAEVRGRVAVLEGQAERYWNKKSPQPGRKDGK